MNRKTLILFCSLLATVSSYGQRWHIAENAPNIVWNIADDIPHHDHIEMSGKQMAFVLRWQVDERGAFRAERSLVFPMLRTVPNNTRAGLMYRMATDIPSLLGVNNLSLDNERVEQVSIDGALRVNSTWCLTQKGAATAVVNPVMAMTRTVFPSCDKPLMCESYLLRNISSGPIRIDIPVLSQVVETDPKRSVSGRGYVISAELTGTGSFSLSPGDSLSFGAVFQAHDCGEDPIDVDVEQEYAMRMRFVHDVVDSNLILETPDRTIDTEFRYAKLRACESIVKTRGGYMHAPGGEAYYAAIWANDQAEYVNPFFPFVGYEVGNESAMNAFDHFARFMNDEWTPLPSSIIAEGKDIWNGAGDRGDAAMIAYGAARYALARGRIDEARKLWPLIEWCLNYCRRQLTPQGVVASDTDELEGRFPAGKANLCTSTQYYDALLSSAYLCRQLDAKSSVAREYDRQAKELAAAIERYFGWQIAGYDTYRYYDGNDKLRSWICMPLIVGLNSRSQQTVDALLGPELLTENGLLTEQGSATFWDRSTLYALRGIYYAGYADRATEQLHNYSQRRLLGDHVPYPIEAWPEGAQRHLSAESGLYCRVITEGLFGIRPTGFRSFVLRPSMPSTWQRMALRHIRAFDTDFDIAVEHMTDGRLLVNITQVGQSSKKYLIKDGAELNVCLKN